MHEIMTGVWRVIGMLRTMTELKHVCPSNKQLTWGTYATFPRSASGVPATCCIRPSMAASSDDLPLPARRSLLVNSCLLPTSDKPSRQCRQHNNDWSQDRQLCR